MNTNADDPFGRQQPAATLTEMFARSVEEHGERAAVSDESRSLTYADLSSLAHRAALGLHALGVRHGDTVAVHTERGVDLVIAVLATLLSGAAYVAVDVRYPHQRRVHMVRATRARVLIHSSTASQDSVPQIEGTRSVTVDRLLADTPVDDWVLPSVQPGDRASILFTSGTTGWPKGVELAHAGLVNFATNPVLPHILPSDRMAQVSSVSFDAFHYELWCALAAGAELVVLPAIPDLLGRDPRREFKRRAITAMLMPTMAVNHLAREDREAFSALRILCTGGDVILPQACREIFDSQFAGELYNLYGPTEATTAATAYRVTEDLVLSQSVPIGRPLRGCHVRLLDDGLRPVPDGEPGQIFVGGVGVALGYLDLPSETAARFVDDPLDPGRGRLYATGDLGRMRPDGLLEFLGRSDDQGKIRGYRVEPFEVERVLRASPLVEDVAVLLHGEGDGKQLAAFLVLASRATPAAVREHLRAELPDYLVPSTLLKVDQIPATENGKRDVDALREVLQNDLHRRENYQKPETRAELYLADLFEELLGVEQVGRDDDFFVLGGHSLLAFRMHRRISRDLGGELRFQDVLRNPRLADLAAVLHQSIPGGPERD